MDFIVKFPIANAVKFTRDGVNSDRRASFDQQRFADALHVGFDERKFFQPLEQLDPLRPQFYTNFPLQKLSVIDCETEEVIDEYTPVLSKQYTRKTHRSTAKLTSIDDQLFIYFNEAQTYTDANFTVLGEVKSFEGRLPTMYAKIGDVVRFNLNDGNGFKFGLIEDIIWVPELQAEGYLINQAYSLNIPIDGLAEIRYNEKDADLYSCAVDLLSLDGVYVLKLELGLSEYLVSYTTEPIDVRPLHKKSLAIGYRHEGGFDDADTWDYIYLSDWMNVIRVPSNFNLINPAGEMEVYADDFGIREQLRAVAFRELTFKAYNQPSWMIDKFNVVFGHDTLKINDALWRPSDFGSGDNVDNTDINGFEITLRQKDDRRVFSSAIQIAVAASFTPASFSDIPAAGDSLVAQFNTDSGAVFKFLSLPDWITADLSEFSDGDFIQFTILENAYNIPREIILTAFSEAISGVTATVAFEQLEGEDEVPVAGLTSVDPEHLAFNGAGEVKTVDVVADAGAQYQAVASHAWITVPGGILSGNQTVNVSASENNTTETRFGSVTFININDPLDTLEVTIGQDRYQRILSVTVAEASNVPPTAITVPYSFASRSATVTVLPGTTWKMSSNVTWLTVPDTLFTGNQTVNFTIGSNDNAFQRVGQITFYSTVNPADRIIATFIQEAAP
jgi:hypothetical protein